MNRCCRCTDRHYGATGINISNAYEPVQSPTQKSFQHQSLCWVRQNESRHQFHKSFFRTLSFTLRSPILLVLALISTHTLIHFKLYVYMRAPISVCMGLIHHERSPIDKWKKKDGEKNTFLRTKAIEMKTKLQIQLVVSLWMCHWINAQMLNTFDSTQQFYKRLTLIATNSRMAMRM